MLVLGYAIKPELPRHHLMLYFWVPALTLLTIFWVVAIKALLEVL